MSVSLIIPTRNQHQVLDQALLSIHNARLDGVGPIEIIVVDNRSDDIQSQHYLQNLTSNHVLNDVCKVSVIPFMEDFNYSKMNNLAASQATGEVLCFLNNDIEVISNDWLIAMKKSLDMANTGCVGALLFYPNDTVQHAGVVLGMGTIAGHAYTGLPRARTQTHPYFQQPTDCSAVTGACLAVRHDYFDQVGGFDENLPVAFNDVDFCLKIKSLGLTNRFLPQVQLYHHESLSRGKGIKNPTAKTRHKQDVRRLKKRWGKAVLKDPYWISASSNCEHASAPQHSPKSWSTRLRQPAAFQHIDHNKDSAGKRLG